MYTTMYVHICKLRYPSDALFDTLFPNCCVHVYIYIYMYTCILRCICTYVYNDILFACCLKHSCQTIVCIFSRIKSHQRWHNWFEM